MTIVTPSVLCRFYNSIMPVRRPRSPTTLAADAIGNIVQIRYGTELFQLREAIDLEARSERGHSVLAYPALDIEGYGHNELGALESFADQFGSTWHSIALAVDAELTRDAREIRKRMLKLVEQSAKKRTPGWISDRDYAS